MVKEIGHFISGKQVKGTSGRFADVFNPNTGEVQAKVALASKAEMRAAVENAKAAQPAWAAKNPQFRGRVMMKFLELAAKHKEELATLISMEHGKTVPDALGDLQRGIEVAEFACGVPHLMKGEFTENASDAERVGQVISKRYRISGLLGAFIGTPADIRPSRRS